MKISSSLLAVLLCTALATLWGCKREYIEMPVPPPASSKYSYEPPSRFFTDSLRFFKPGSKWFYQTLDGADTCSILCRGTYDDRDEFDGAGMVGLKLVASLKTVFRREYYYCVHYRAPYPGEAHAYDRLIDYYVLPVGKVAFQGDSIISAPQFGFNNYLRHYPEFVKNNFRYEDYYSFEPNNSSHGVGFTTKLASRS